MMPPAGRILETIQAPIAALPQVYSSACSLPGRLGFEESKWREICASHIEAACELCGMKISGMELSQLASARSREELGNNKLERLHFHYCARKSCDSRYYRIHFLPHPEIDWGKLKSAIQESINLLPSADSSREPLSFRFKRGKAIGVALGAMAALIMIVLIYHAIYGGRIPLIQKRNYYTTNPTPDAR